VCTRWYNNCYAHAKRWQHQIRRNKNILYSCYIRSCYIIIWAKGTRLSIALSWSLARWHYYYYYYYYFIRWMRFALTGMCITSEVNILRVYLSNYTHAVGIVACRYTLLLICLIVLRRTCTSYDNNNDNAYYSIA